jgi:hypothetical protein
MMSFYRAYQCFERRVIRGELHSRLTRQPLRVRLGDWLIRAGLRLKRPYSAEPRLNSSTLSRSIP